MSKRKRKYKKYKIFNRILLGVWGLAFIVLMIILSELSFRKLKVEQMALIESFNLENETLNVKLINTNSILNLIWDEKTRFLLEGRPDQYTSLAVGREVHIRYMDSMFFPGTAIEVCTHSSPFIHH